MRSVFLICLSFILPHVGFSQTKADYQRVMDKFIRCYNAQQYDSVYQMFSAETRQTMTSERNAISLGRFWDKYGKVVSYEYLGIDNDDPEHVTVFTVKWSKGGDKTASFTLDKENKFETWRFVTSSEGIEKLLKNKK